MVEMSKPPVPQGLVELLHDRPGYLAEIQGAINDVAASPLQGTPLFEQFLWTLQGVTERLVGDARAVEKAASSSGDDEAIRRAKAEVSILLQCTASSEWRANNLMKYARAMSSR